MNIAVNIFDAHSIVGDLGLIGILAIVFAETGLLIGLAFPGDSLLFVAGVAASGSGAALLGAASLDPLLLFIGAPIAAILGSQVGYLFGARYGRKFFNRPDGRFFNQSKVAATEKWLNKYGTGKALVLARFIPFVRTLINPLAGIVGVPVKKFFFWNVLGALIWTQLVIGLGYLLGNKLEGSVDKYLLPVVAVIIFVSVIPVLIELFREWSTRKHHS
ncbi:MAG: DedA family protein [Candidatus Planktophila sp.]|jgi:membrane-associated protein|tara:strand:+ start:630 stop:1280 length:651 start_codon:yes stop_codon:yes gene_type:complete